LSVPGYSGSGYAQLVSQSATSGNIADVAQLKYTVSFPEAGEYAIFFRGYASKGREYLVTTLLNEAPSQYARYLTGSPWIDVYRWDPSWISATNPPTGLPDLSDISGFYQYGISAFRGAISPTLFESWQWHASRLGSGSGRRHFIWVPSAGEHELSVCLSAVGSSAEGFLLDQICLSRNPNFSPYYTDDFWEKQSIYQILTDRFYDGDPSNNNATDGTVVVEPNPPAAGQQVKITYMPSARSLGAAQQVNIYRGQDGWNSVVSQPMTKEGSIWTTTFSVPIGARELNFVFNDGANNWDNNGYANWNVPVGAPLVTFSPDPPVAGKQVTITYNSAGRNLSSAQSVGIHMGKHGGGGSALQGQHGIHLHQVSL
jgi:hypothetical protein